MAIQQQEAAAAITPEALATLPAVTAKNYKYDQPELDAKVGETVALRLDNADNTTHYFEVDDLGVHVTMSAWQERPDRLQTDEGRHLPVYCSPHADKQAGTGMVTTTGGHELE